MKAKIEHGDKGFSVTFPNGLTISVQYGYGNYCSNKDRGDWDAKGAEVGESATFEFAVWDMKGEWLLKTQVVVGFVPVQELPNIMLLVKNGDMDKLNNMIADQNYA